MPKTTHFLKSDRPENSIPPPISAKDLLEGNTFKKPKGKTYKPVIAIFAVAFLMALSTGYALTRSISIIPVAELFIAFSMCILGIQKLQNLSAFRTGFLKYDLLAQKIPGYATLYPFIETGAGVLMIASLFTWLAAPAALFISTIGAVSVFKAVYLQKQDLECACTGGTDSVPLGFISLIENLMMMAMSIWMIAKVL